MKLRQTVKFIRIIYSSGIVAMAILLCSCESKTQDQEIPDGTGRVETMPDFITPNGDYFDTRISGIPSIDRESYQLKISGSVSNPTTLSLEELYSLDMFKRALTIECIGNPVNGALVGTATWRGFRVFDLLDDLGIIEGASIVKYTSADGYYTYNSLEELKHAEVLGAMFMNDEPIPPLYGFPLRIIFPGYYGVRQPGWIVEMEVLASGAVDFWSESGWKTGSPMDIDSKIFFPAEKTEFFLGDTVKIGGTAFGSRRISSVDITLDDGKSWIPASITRSLDQDYVWVFWEVSVTLQNKGSISIRSKATGSDGSIQPKTDNIYLDGTNSWPLKTITVLEGS